MIKKSFGIIIIRLSRLQNANPLLKLTLISLIKGAFHEPRVTEEKNHQKENQ